MVGNSQQRTSNSARWPLPGWQGTSYGTVKHPSQCPRDTHRERERGANELETIGDATWTRIDWPSFVCCSNSLHVQTNCIPHLNISTQKGGDPKILRIRFVEYLLALKPSLPYFCLQKSIWAPIHLENNKICTGAFRQTAGPILRMSRISRTNRRPL